LRLLTEDALARGAHPISGPVCQDTPWLTPIILGGVPHTSRLLQEDVFAPVLAVVTVDDDCEAIQRANDCPFALAASIFSRHEEAAWQLASRLNVGVVTINDLIIPTADPRLPFGGRARSGFGVTRGAEGLLELTEPKVITVSRGKFRPAFDPPRPGDDSLVHAYIQLAHGRGWKPRWLAFVALVRSILRGRKPALQVNL
jgi:acyl-CoA reductase-like NAD-dependent aldehyde dehydrogenase